MSLHNNLAGALDCDHLHDGMGFLTSHVQMTRLLEASLQAVDASVSLPYWEYTKDVEIIVAQYNGNFQKWADLEIFSDEFFGKTNLATATIDTGHFKDLDVLPGSEGYSTVTNSFGLIRAPWNNLNTLKPTRYFGAGGNDVDKVVSYVAPDQTSMSTCANLQTVLYESYKQGLLTYFSEEIAQQAHGPIHLFTGGLAHTPDLLTWISDTFASSVSATKPSYPQYWNTILEFWLVVQRAAYRFKLYTCPESCDVATDTVETCSCSCDADEVFSSDMYAEIFESFGFTETFSDDEIKSLLSYMCDNTIVVGDHGSSSSPNDPSFWPIHGTVERYSQFLRLHQAFGEDAKGPNLWPDPGQSVFADNIHPFEDRCVGHYADDKLVFGPVDGADFTNIEYFAHISPLSDHNTYVYDNFIWGHCEEAGSPIDGKLFWNVTSMAGEAPPAAPAD
jgi:hypothetical protein